MSTPTTSHPSLTRDELLRRAERLVPALKARAVRTEQLRQIPAETVDDLIASGLIRIGNPRRYGGHGVEVDTAFAVAWELGRGCAVDRLVLLAVDDAQLVDRSLLGASPGRVLRERS